MAVDQFVLDRPVDAAIMDYAKGMLPMVIARMKACKPDKSHVKPYYKFSWGPTHPRPKHPTGAEFMVQMESALAVLLTEAGYNLSFVTGDADKAIFIHWHG